MCDCDDEWRVLKSAASVLHPNVNECMNGNECECAGCRRTTESYARRNGNVHAEPTTHADRGIVECTLTVVPSACKIEGKRVQHPYLDQAEIVPNLTVSVGRFAIPPVGKKRRGFRCCICSGGI